MDEPRIDGGDPEALDADAADVIRAAVERIVPSGDGPGAREAGTASYVLRRVGANATVLGGYQRLAARLAALAAASAPGRSFAGLPADAQDAALVALETDGDPAFRRLVIDTMEGFYGDPAHGGNAGAVGWAILGFPGPTGGTGYVPPLGWYDAATPENA